MSSAWLICCTFGFSVMLPGAQPVEEEDDNDAITKATLQVTTAAGCVRCDAVRWGDREAAHRAARQRSIAILIHDRFFAQCSYVQ